MKLSLCNEVIRDLPFDRQCAFAAAVGYDGLEIAPFTLSDAPQDWTEREAARLGQMMQAEGLVCSSLHWLLVVPTSLSITDPDPAIRQRTSEVIERLIDFAAALGAEVLVHGSPAQRALPDGSAAKARARGEACLQVAAEKSAAAGVTYCIEPLAASETNYINTVAEAIAIVEKIDNPAFQTMIDCCAAGRQEGNVAALIDRWMPGGHIAHIQVNDPNRRGPGEGELAFGPILAALARHKFAGWIAVEPFIYEPDGPACAARAAGYLRGLEESMR